MHNYLRAIGFENIKSREDIQNLIAMTVQKADSRSYVTKDGDKLLGEFCKDFADGIGICVCGEFNEQDKFMYDYYYPYIRGTGITTEEDITVTRHASRESYAGVCDDLRVGVTIIFYLQNKLLHNQHLHSQQLELYLVRRKYMCNPYPLPCSE